VALVRRLGSAQSQPVHLLHDWQPRIDHSALAATVLMGRCNPLLGEITSCSPLRSTQRLGEPGRCPYLLSPEDPFSATSGPAYITI